PLTGNQARERLALDSMVTGNYHLYYLSESALVADFGNRIDESINRKVISMANELRNARLPEVLDIIPAYASVTIQFDPVALQHRFGSYPDACAWMESLLTDAEKVTGQTTAFGRMHRVPVCYESPYSTDLSVLSDQLALTGEEIISLHYSRSYRVYMLAFLPGFPYMAAVDDRIVCNRKPQPVTTVAGSVGIAGQQTGIYPVDSPGGWHIIGRTPETVFDARSNGPFMFAPGDTVEFYPISANEFKDHQGRCA
ncbi:MAG TPA: 5-oxoprolinase subunit PxpB, partial [Chitinophagaceae bacterium]